MEAEQPGDELIPLMKVPDILRRPISKTQLYKWAKQGIRGRQLQTVRRGNRHYVRRSEIGSFAREAYGLWAGKSDARQTREMRYLPRIIESW
jgi:hypothetical protein